MRGGQRDVHVARLADRLAAVQRLHDGQLARPLLDEPGDAEQVLAALERRQRPPGGAAARAASTAFATSSGPAYATSASGSSVAGLTVGCQVPPAGATYSPPM